MERPPTFEREPDNPKRSSIENIIEGTPDAVFVLTGSLKFKEQLGRWESGTYGDRDENSGLVTGGKDRTIAAAEISKHFPDMTIVTMSRPRDPEKPTYAGVMAEELYRMHVPQENVVQETESTTTITEIKAIAKFVKQHGWRDILLLSSKYHLPRIQALLEHATDFSDDAAEAELLRGFAERINSGKTRVQLVGSDDILMGRDEHYRRYFDRLYTDPEYRKKVEAEQRAVRQIEETRTYGHYKLSEKRIRLLSTKGTP